MNNLKLFVCVMAYACSLLPMQGQTALFQNDKDVRIGKLKNGLTYYIRHNAYPKDRAYFYIAQQVGSIQEKPEQRGLAHFLEHMCFNGTTHFPGNGLRQYLERIGVKFGVDLNAYTSVDETVYNIDNVPTTEPTAVDSCLWILHDWSHDLTLDDEEIDKERGVIQEEWRMRNNARQRINESIMPKVMEGSKYADCMPIGNMDVVMHFDHSALRDYYRTWYRPDLQAVVIVGDVDVAKVEKKLKKIFADIPAAAQNAPERIYYPVKPNAQPQVIYGRDKEMTDPMVVYYFHRPAATREQKNTRKYLVDAYLDGLIYTMFHDRTIPLAQKAHSPFGFCYVRNGEYFLAKTEAAFAATVACHKGIDGTEKGVNAMLRELSRVVQYGFTATEYQRNQTVFLQDIEKRLDNIDKRESKSFVNEYVRNFIDGDAIPSLQDEIQFYRKVIPTVTVDDLNARLRELCGDQNNLKILVEANDTVKLPDEAFFVEAWKKAQAEKQTPYIDDMPTEPFLPKQPVSGKITGETTDAEGRIHLTLSNGAKVIVMKTDCRKDQILMQGLSHGGASLYPVEDYRFASLINMMLGVQGFGNYNYTQMQKAFAGVKAKVDASITDNFQNIAGYSTRNDLPKMMEMAYAAFLYPHKDTVVFHAMQERLAKSYKTNLEMNGTMFADSMQYTLFGKTPYIHTTTDVEYENVSYDHLLDLYRERFADASSFTFTFVGDVDMDALRPLVEKYLASLPSLHRKEQAKPINKVLPGTRSCYFTKKEENEKVTVMFEQTYKCDFNLRNSIMADMLGQIMNIVYTRTIREDAGAAYSVGCGAALDYYPENQVRYVVQFPTNEKQRDLAIKLIKSGLEDLAGNGPQEADFQKVREYLQKIHASNVTTNGYWQFALSYEWNHGELYDKDYMNTLNGITAKDIQQFTKQILTQGNQVTICQTSVKE